MRRPAIGSAELEAARDGAADQVSDVLLNLEWTLEKAGKAHAAVATQGNNPKVQLALGDAIRDLARVHTSLMRNTYFAS